jgi:hypothetical protein
METILRMNGLPGQEPWQESAGPEPANAVSSGTAAAIRLKIRGVVVSIEMSFTLGG